MTRDETKKLLMSMQAAYPTYKTPDKTVTTNLWHEMLCDYPYRLVDAALKSYILSDKSGFPPSIGQVIDKLQIFVRGEELNEMAAWQMVLKAMRNSIYHAEEEYEKLPGVVQRAVVNPGTLREWAMSENVDGAWMSVTQSNFMRTYRAEVAREKELMKLPLELQKLARSTDGVLKVTGKNQLAAGI